MLSMMGKNVLIGFCVIGVVFVSIEGRKSEKGVRIVLTFLLVECLNTIFEPICKNAFMTSDKKYSESIYYFAIGCCTAMSLFIFYVIKDRIFRYQNMHIGSTIYFIIGSVVISMLFCLKFLNQVIDYLRFSRYVIFCNILNIAILFSIFFLVIHQFTTFRQP